MESQEDLYFEYSLEKMQDDEIVLDIDFFNKKVVSQSPYGRDQLRVKMNRYGDVDLIKSRSSFDGLSDYDLEEMFVDINPIVDLSIEEQENMESVMNTAL